MIGLATDVGLLFISDDQKSQPFLVIEDSNFKHF